jgi:DNA (cytosine-5)-methyltransferase 1
VNELALFSGAGGGILGGILCGFRTVCAVEINPYCREVLLRRQEEGILPAFPIWDDVRTFDGTAWAGAVDIISAGFPCQPFSVAGKRKGADDERNLWPQTIRIIREVRPEWVLLENVPGLLATGYIWTIAGELSEAGYSAGWEVISASDVGANHRRARWWCLAHAAKRQNAQRKPGSLAGETQEWQSGDTATGTGSENVPDPKSTSAGCESEIPQRGGPQSGRGLQTVSDSPKQGLERHESEVQLRQPGRLPSERGWWATEPGMGRLADGVANRLVFPYSFAKGEL